MSTKVEEAVLLRDICSSDEELSVLESVPTPKGDYTGVVLASLDGPVLDYRIPTRNDRLYEEEMCDEIFGSDYIKELIDTKNFLGEPDHPMEYQKRMDIHYPNVSHAIRNLRKVPSKGCYYATFDILDTPNGRILKTLIDYGTKLGVSSRGTGRTIMKMGKQVVDRNTYRFITFDIVNLPGNKVARLPSVTNESVSTDSSMTLTEQVSHLIESDDKDSLRSIKPVLNFLSESEDIKDLIKKVDNKLSEDEVSTTSATFIRDITEAFLKNKALQSELSSKESIIRDMSSELDTVKEDLRMEQTTKSENSDRLEKLSNLVKTYLAREQSARKELGAAKETISDLKETIDQQASTISSLRSKVNKVTSKLKDESAKKDNQLDKLRLETNQQSADLDSMSEQLEYVSRRYDALAKRYLSVRCSQLGLNESRLVKSLDSNLNRYDSDELEEVLQESYLNKPVRAQKSATTTKISGGKVISAKKISTSINNDNSLLQLTESCRSVKNS